MIRFFTIRFLFAFLRLRIWLLCALIPPLIYLGVEASIPDRFLVSRDISISQDTEMPSPFSPVGTMPLSELISKPADFLLDKYAVKEISDMLIDGKTGGQESALPRILLEKIRSEISLVPLAKEKMRVT